jgi:hypothetical protein
MLAAENAVPMSIALDCVAIDDVSRALLATIPRCVRDE